MGYDYTTTFTVMAYRDKDYYPCYERGFKTRKGAVNHARKLSAKYGFVKVVREQTYDCGMEMAQPIYKLDHGEVVLNRRAA
jgi:hypothetical protein